MLRRYSSVIGALCIMLSSPIAAETISLNKKQMVNAAANAVISGNAAQGYALTTALLRRDPNDAEALIIRARAARDMGRLSEAKTLARRAWQLADTSSERFGASMVMAQALSTSNSKTRAQLWLRRAAQNAPNDDMKRIAIRDFRYVRRTNPWATELSFAISPNSNINNGSARSSTRLFDLPFEFQLSGAARALSGLEYSGGIATRYRISENARNQNDLLFRLDHRTYTMTPEAKRLAPNTEGKDFAFSAASLSYIRRGFSSAETKLPHQIEVTAGRTWYAQQPFMEYARLGFTQNFVVGQGQMLFAGATRELQRSLSTRQDVDSWGLKGGLRLALANNDQMTVSVSSKKSNSRDPSLDFTQLTLGARYAFAQQLAGISIDMGASISHKNHELSRYSRFGRSDQTVSVDITGVFNQLEYLGFSPSVTLSTQKTQSTIGLFESQGFGIRVGVQSAF